MITILGASGFLGGAVVHELASRPLRVRAVSRGGIPELPGATAWIEDVRADLTRPGRLAAAVRGADSIVHTVGYAAAGSTWRTATAGDEPGKVTVGIVRDLVAALRDRPADPPPVLVYASTAQAADPAAAGRYARQKIEAEALLRRAGADGLARPVIIRLPMVYGSGGPTRHTGRGVVAAAARKAAAGECVTMWGDGSVRRNLLHVRDAARALTAALDHHEALVGGTWQLSGERTEPLSSIFAAVVAGVARRTGGPAVPVVSVPAPADAEANDFRSDELDSAEFRTRTGWRPAVRLEDGIDGVVAAVLPVGDRP